MQLSNAQGPAKVRGGGGSSWDLDYERITSLENLLEAWREFLRGKRGRKDVQEFGHDLMHNVLALHRELVDKTYRHSAYGAFKISDPKPRNIHKAAVRDRLLHHALHRVLYPLYDRIFISDSFSCRVGKGSHRALDRFRAFATRISKNHTWQAWVLKCDIRKFFASINHEQIIGILRKRITDHDVLWLFRSILDSFETSPGRGLPLGNLTSQLLANIYMNEFDQFVKHELKARYYIRYADDFVLFSQDRKWLEAALILMQQFLADHLCLTMHPDKVSIQTVSSGVDFLGWVHFPDHRVLRTTTKRRVIKGIKKAGVNKAVIHSYLGLMRHGNTWKLRQALTSSGSK